MDKGKVPADVCREPLPDKPELALFVATLFTRLGGRLEIDRRGRRRAIRPERFDFRDRGVPQFGDASPHERFQSTEEWEGAMKLAEYWFNRLGAPDKEYVYMLLAPLELDHHEAFDFRRLS
jgi:hypothetical protein